MPRPGDRFAGRFVVDAQIGSGGFGVVYRARHERTGQRCALKVLTADALFDDEARRRFLDEARRTPSDRSDHVVRVYDADVTDGIPWLSMELLEGATLGAHIRAHGPLSPSDFDRFFGQLCDGVGAAHARGIVHRDLKPENVFLHRRDGTRAPWSVKVLDFGVAKQLEGSSRAGNASVAVRTDGWGAPEQTVLGTITPAADVWSLGLLAYFALTGLGYFGDLALGETVVPATVRARGQGVAARLPEGFDGWFARCVAWDPGARYRDAHEALEGLRALRGAPPAPRAPRHGRYALGLLAAVLALVTAGWLLGRRANADQPVPIDAPEPVQRAVRAWLDAMARREMNDATAARLYARRVRFNGERASATPTDLRRYWRARMAFPAWSFLLDDAEAIRSSPERPEVPPNASVTCTAQEVHLVDLPMVQREPDRATRTSGSVPCDELRGRYLLYLQRSSGAWQICHETFARSAICASCPGARGCQGR